MLKPNHTNKYYTPIQLKLPLEIERIIDISDPVYSFNEIMNNIDLKEHLAVKEHGIGRPRCDSVKMLKIILFSFMENGYLSLRNIEKSCKTDIRYMWLLDGMKPPTYVTFGNFIKNELSEEESRRGTVVDLVVRRQAAYVGESSAFPQHMKLKALLVLQLLVHVFKGGRQIAEYRGIRAVAAKGHVLMLQLFIVPHGAERGRQMRPCGEAHNGDAVRMYMVFFRVLPDEPKRLGRIQQRLRESRFRIDALTKHKCRVALSHKAQGSLLAFIGRVVFIGASGQDQHGRHLNLLVVMRDNLRDIGIHNDIRMNRYGMKLVYFHVIPPILF